MDEKQLQAQLETLKSELKAAATSEAKAEIEKQIKALEAKIPDVKKLEDGIEEIKGWQVKKDEADKKNQAALDQLIAKGNDPKLNGQRKSFSSAFGEAIEEKQDDLIKFAKEKKRDHSVKIDLKNIEMDLKTVGNMTLTTNLSGDQVASYGGRNGLIPGDSRNFRDLVPTTRTSTGLYVFYRESAGEGSVSRQTEGSAKSQVDSDFTEVKVVQRYLAAFQRVSKQMMQDLPWLQTTLARILLRKFYQAENTEFYTALATASDPHTASGGNTAEKIIDLIATQRQNNFSASFVLITYTDWVALMKTAYPSTGDSYSIPGGVTFSADGQTIYIGGVPVIAAPWVTSGDIQVVDSAYIERVEVDGLSVELSYEDADNFTKNLVTARIECREELNLLRTDAHLNIGTAS